MFGLWNNTREGVRYRYYWHDNDGQVQGVCSQNKHYTVKYRSTGCKIKQCYTAGCALPSLLALQWCGHVILMNYHKLYSSEIVDLIVVTRGHSVNK